MKPKEHNRSSSLRSTKVFIPKYKLYMSICANDDGSSLNVAITAEHPTPSFPTLPTRKKAYSPGPSGENIMDVAASRLPEEVHANTLLW